MGSGLIARWHVSHSREGSDNAPTPSASGLPSQVESSLGSCTGLRAWQVTERGRREQVEPQRQSSAELLSDAEPAGLPLECFPSVAARHGARVVGPLGVGAAPSAVLDGFLGSLGSGGGVSMALVMSEFFGWQEEGSPRRHAPRHERTFRSR